MKTRLTVIAASLVFSPLAGAFGQTSAPVAPTAAGPVQFNGQQFQGPAQAAGRGAAGGRGGQTLAQNFQAAPGGAFGGQAGRGQAGGRGGFQAQGGQQAQGPGANGFQGGGGRGGPPGGRGGPGGPGGGGPGGRGPVVNATPPDPISESFRNQASAVSGSGAQASILLVTNYGWMRSTRTLKVGTEFEDGWILKELDSSKAVLAKPDNPDKVIDLSRWTGDTGTGYNPSINANANGPTNITFSAIGTVRSNQTTAIRPPQPAPAPARPAQPAATAGRGPANAPQAGGRGATTAASGAVVNVQGQAQRGR